MKGPFDPATAAPIPTDEARISHVIKHLLAPRERWDLVTDGLPRDPIAAGAAEGCGPMLLAPGRASFHDLSPRGQAWLLGLHDNHLRPAYLAAVQSATATGRWGWWQADMRVQAALVGDNGVFVIVKESGRPAQAAVCTAYRVLPRGGRGEATQDDFLRAAVRKLNDKTSFGEKRS